MDISAKNVSDYEIMKINGATMKNIGEIFHYTKISTAVEHILYKKCLKFSKGAKTNDPREYRRWEIEPHFDGVCPDTKFSQENLDAEKSLKKIRDNYKYACFCLNDDPKQEATELKGFERLRMWSQYGENFFGACIKFSTKSLFEKLNEKSITSYAKPVYYDKNLDSNDALLIDVNADEYIDKSKDSWAIEYIQKHIDQIFFTKHEDYRDEKEYRIVVHDPKNVLEDLDIAGCIKGVYLGDRTEQVYDKIVKQFCLEMNAHCKRVIWHRGRLNLIDIPD